MDVFHDLGFRGFLHFNKSKRDQIERKAWIGYYKGNIIHFRAKHVDNKWTLDAFDFGIINDERTVKFYIGMDIEEVFDFIRSNCQHH